MRTLVTSGKTRLVAALGVAGVAALGLVASAQQMPLDPARERGLGITPAYEGWFPNEDGSFSLLLGYYNRNTKQAIDIPVGPDNKIEPGEPDQGQPTHFETGREWGVFAVKVPKDFGNKAITWTIVANGHKESIPFTLNKGYPIAPYKELGMGNAPPVLSFAEGGPKFTGPPMAVAQSYTAKVNEALPLKVWVEDPKNTIEAPTRRGRGGVPPVATVSLHKFRGPGNVTFDKERLPATRQGEQLAATATFSAPGDYLLRVQANDESGEGGGGFQCCWTNTYLKVTVQ